MQGSHSTSGTKSAVRAALGAGLLLVLIGAVRPYRPRPAPPAATGPATTQSVPTVTNAVLGKPEGRIVRIAPDPTIVLIDRGIGDHVVPGTSFDVYDRKTGLHKPAQLEVVESMPGYSECRVINLGPGNR